MLRTCKTETTKFQCYVVNYNSIDNTEHSIDETIKATISFFPVGHHFRTEETCVFSGFLSLNTRPLKNHMQRYSEPIFYIIM